VRSGRPGRDGARGTARATATFGAIVPTPTPTSVPASVVGPWCQVAAPRSLRATLGVFRHGHHDPTTSLGPGRFVRATLTPDGPGTLALCWSADPATIGDEALDASAWGPGADWLLARVDRLTGSSDHPVALRGSTTRADAVVADALRATRTFRYGASGTLYHELLPTIVEQRITAREALRQWAHLCLELGRPAPGPAGIVGAMRLPPEPETLARRPTWWFHPLGIEAKRARALVEVARHPRKLFEWADASSDEVANRLRRIPGVGPWTIGSVLGPALGDADAVAVGDYHFPHAITWALAGEVRGDDDRMLALLEPYRGHRGRVLRAVVRTVGTAPRLGPRRRILPMARW
jgi:3-methyladenine DNA glycosylase/8-oxoguanine DNA glycosylase